jgi:hypothetical protein
MASDRGPGGVGDEPYEAPRGKGESEARLYGAGAT